MLAGMLASVPDRPGFESWLLLFLYDPQSSTLATLSVRVLFRVEIIVSSMQGCSEDVKQPTGEAAQPR